LKKLIYVLMLLLCCSFIDVYATIDWDKDMVFFYNGTEVSNNLVDQTTNKYNSSTTAFVEVDNGTDKYISPSGATPTAVSYADIMDFTAGSTGTFALWVQPDVGAGTTHFITRTAGGDDRTISFDAALNNDGSVTWLLQDQGGGVWTCNINTGAGTIVDGTWYHIVLSANFTACQIWLDGVSSVTGTGTNYFSADNALRFNYRNRAGTEGYGNHNYTAIMGFNRTLSDDEIVTLYAAGPEFNPFFNVSHLNINLISPPDNHINNTNQNFTFNYTNNDFGFNDFGFCYLYSNFTGTWGIDDTLNTGLEQNKTLSFGFQYLTDGIYKWTTQCSILNDTLQSVWDESVSVWHMDENVTTPLITEDSKASNDGTFSGYTFNNGLIKDGVTCDSTYSFNGDAGCGFNGSNGFINFTGITSSLTKMNTGTISFWIKPAANKFDFPFWIGNSTSTGDYLGLNNQGDGRFIMDLRVNGSQMWRLDTSAIYNKDKWIHLTFTHDGTQPRFYVNGSEDSTLAVSNFPTVFLDDTEGFNVTLLGARRRAGNAPQNWFNGTIDEVRIWNRSLSSDEVLAEYENSTSYAVNGHGLVMSQNFNSQFRTAAGVNDSNHLVMGVIDSAARLDEIGTYIDGGNVLNFGTGDFSIFTWIKYSISSGFLVMKGAQGAGGKRYQFSTASGCIWFGIDDNSVNTEFSGCTNLNDGDWHFVGVTADRSENATLYADGIKCTSKDITPSALSIDDAGNPFTLGKRSDSAAGYFTGIMDEVLIINKSLSLKEIQALYNAGASVRFRDPESTWSATNYTFTFDNSTPTITAGSNSFFIPDESTIGNDTIESLTLNITFADERDLYAIVLNITNSSGHSFYDILNLSLSGLKVYNLTRTINLTNMSHSPNGTVYLEVSDSHTKIKIPEWWTPKVKGNVIEVEGIKITAEGAREAHTFREKDRINFEVKYDGDYSYVKKYYLESKNELHYLPDSDYTGHFVDYKSKQWIDFEGIDDEPLIKKISNNKYLIQFETNRDTIKFKSVGLLNSANVTYTFIIDATAPDYAWVTETPEVMNYNRSFTARLLVNDTNRNHTTFRLYNASRTLINTTVVYDSGSGVHMYNQTFFNLDNWRYLVNATVTDQFGQSVNTTVDRIVYRPTIDNCSEVVGHIGTPTINFTFINETDSSNVTGEFEITFNYYYTDLDGVIVYQNYSFETNNTQNQGFCIHLNSSNVTSDFQIDYEVGGESFNYFGDDIVLDNTSRNIILYSQEDTTQVTFNVKDTFDNNIEDSYITVDKYDVGTNTFKTVEILKTDNQGNALGQIILNTAWYRFNVKYNGIVYLVDGPTQVFTTTKNFRINLAAADWFDNYDIYNGVAYNFTFSNTTKNYVFIWNDPNSAMHLACLKVEQIRSSPSNILINHTCVDSYSGVIIVNIGVNASVSGNTYLGTAYFKFDDVEPVGSIWARFFESGWKTYNDTGVFVTFLMVAASALLLIVNPVFAIIGVIITMAATALLGFHYMGFQLIMVLAIMGFIVIWRSK